MNFEDDLRAALRREQPPPGFTAQAIAKANAVSARARERWLAAGLAACLLLGGGGFEYRQYQGRKAKSELLFALEITGSKLTIAQQKVINRSEKTIHD